MGEATGFTDRLRNGLVKLDQEQAGVWDAEALTTLRRSLELTISRIESGVTEPSKFRFQFTGGKALLFQGNEALPMEPARLFSLLNALGINLQPGETLDLDGGMAAWLIRPEVAITDNSVRQAEDNLRVLKMNRENRDHAAIQSADSLRIRLRTKLTQLVGALQQANSAANAPIPPVSRDTSVRPAPKQETAVRPAPNPTPAPVAPPPPPNPEPGISLSQAQAPAPAPAPVPTPAPAPVQRETKSRPAPPPAEPAPADAAAEPEPAKPSGPTEATLSLALRKIVSAIEGSGFKWTAIGDIGHLSWGFTDHPIVDIELIVGFGEKQAEQLLSAARGEGLYMASSGAGSYSLRFVDKKMGTTANVEIIQAMTPVYREMLNRAKPDFVLNTQVRVASCEDLIVLRTGSEEPGHRDSVIHLLRTCAARIDPTYLKAVAQKFDVLEELKSAWQEAKKPLVSSSGADGA